MLRTGKKLYKFLTDAILVLVVLLALIVVGTRLAGLSMFAVLSGSMEPTYPTGSLLFVKETDPFTLSAGQAITFLLDEDTVATHRIVEVVPDENDPGTVRFRTKGDANDAVDGALVHWKNVLGVPVWCIPGIGRLVYSIQSPPGSYAALAVGALLLLLLFLPELFGEKETVPAKKKGESRRTGD